MVKIAFCDDDHAALSDLCGFLQRYRMTRDREIAHTAFHSPLELLCEIEKGATFDIVFLDVFLPGETGIDVAAEIRNFDSNVKIIFLASSAEYAVQSYAVNAYYYQIKPIWEEKFFCLMDSAIAACDSERSDSLILRCKGGITRIALRQLEYCEVIHRTLFIHLSGGKVLECTGSLDGLSKQLECHSCFLRLHRSYLINLDYVQSLSYRAVTMSCLTEIPLPRGKYHQIKETYLEYMRQSGHRVV